GHSIKISAAKIRQVSFKKGYKQQHFKMLGSSGKNANFAGSNVDLPKKIAYITVSDPRDKHAWSGTNHYIWKALEKRFGQVD
ncbi:UNVERIFIED_CONTAM: hypothetical protein IGO34_34730, partial [Salmonella enterica subsp. enterica serovar Weltevreden]